MLERRGGQGRSHKEACVCPADKGNKGVRWNWRGRAAPSGAARERTPGARSPVGTVGSYRHCDVQCLVFRGEHAGRAG
eukprot:scaffold320_cov54-Phaeocystis_antarctica.AAC.3